MSLDASYYIGLYDELKKQEDATYIVEKKDGSLVMVKDLTKETGNKKQKKGKKKTDE